MQPCPHVYVDKINSIQLIQFNSIQKIDLSAMLCLVQWGQRLLYVYAMCIRDKDSCKPRMNESLLYIPSHLVCIPQMELLVVYPQWQTSLGGPPPQETPP